MTRYTLPQGPGISFGRFKFSLPRFRFKKRRKRFLIGLGASLLLLLAVGGAVWMGGTWYANAQALLAEIRSRALEAGASATEVRTERVIEREYIPQTTQEEKVIDAVKSVSPAVVSVVGKKEITATFFGISNEGLVEQKQSLETKEVSRGSGFFVSADGMVVTNKHVVQDKNASYSVVTSAGKTYEARVLARDPVQDVAILKVSEEQKFSFARLADSSALQIGQSVVAIGNALGEFRNTVSVGVISGLGRTITASGGNFVETIYDVIQTDSAINQGNSGGPLLNLQGEVIGVNTATVIGAQNIGFAIPIDQVRRGIAQLEQSGTIAAPFLGVRYVMITPEVAERYNLPVLEGALVTANAADLAITPDSPAAKVGIRQRDIIVKIDGEKIDKENALGKIIQRHSPGDIVLLTILREGKEFSISLTLSTRTE
ncbi:MAG: trypsin-like peptidase domain-containing protein [Candidatus Wildermuthbacteria bacterium]|nr:trypsin-like peptidase domain-containing protein [Candidatus Wildermuthbacteria bacterium]